MKTVRQFAAIIGFSLVSTAGFAQTNISIATAYQDTNFHTQNIAQFAAEVEEMTDGEVTFTLHTGASLLKMPEIMRGVQTGQVQAGEILLSAYGQESPFFEVDGIPFLSQGQKTAWQVYELTLPYIEARLEEKGLMPLFAVPWPGQGLYAQKEITAASDYEGVKFRAYNALTARFAELMGAVPTTVQSAEVPQAFATGVVSAMITSAATGNYTKAWDFTSHYYDVNAMNNKNMVIMNADAFNGLSEEHQDAVLAAAAKAEARGWIMSNAVQSELTANLSANGMTVAQPNDELMVELEAIGGTMVEEWLVKAGDEGAAFYEAYQALD
ncbi:TRAP transporter substrate-binding protein [uncultured Ruegeria sp.]|uniref:TRAP transporter substrate-binding protein n=1 Tax=uncultured Ruegeria sp. TaxID=259304 RepID=UPI00262EC6BA|nr:TRAP transporter substrate-binding protein [uncultured Ruegeria sp.]